MIKNGRGRYNARKNAKEAFQSHVEKERQRIAAAAANTTVHKSSDDDSSSASDDDEDDEEYQPSWIGKQRIHSETVTLELNVKELQKTVSACADQRKLSSRGRSDMVTEMVLQGCPFQPIHYAAVSNNNNNNNFDDDDFDDDNNNNNNNNNNNSNGV